jgi:hypothetical protein
MSLVKGVPSVCFGVLSFHDLLDKDKDLGHVIKDIHEALNFVMLF